MREAGNMYLNIKTYSLPKHDNVMHKNQHIQLGIRNFFSFQNDGLKRFIFLACKNYSQAIAHARWGGDMRDLGLAVSGAKVGMVSSQHEAHPASNVIDR